MDDWPRGFDAQAWVQCVILRARCRILLVIVASSQGVEENNLDSCFPLSRTKKSPRRVPCSSPDVPKRRVHHDAPTTPRPTLPKVVSLPLPHRKRCLTLLDCCVKTTNPTPQRPNPARSIWSPREAANRRSADVIAFLAGHTLPREGNSPFRDGPRNCTTLFLLG